MIKLSADTLTPGAAMTEKKLAEIEDRCNAATEGPWEFFRPAGEIRCADGRCRCETWGDCYVDDGQFIAHARTDIPYLLAQVRAMSAALRPFIALAAELEQRKIARASRLWVSEDNDTDLGACDVYDAAAAYAALAASGGTEEGR